MRERRAEAGVVGGAMPLRVPSAVHLDRVRPSLHVVSRGTGTPSQRESQGSAEAPPTGMQVAAARPPCLPKLILPLGMGQRMLLTRSTAHHPAPSEGGDLDETVFALHLLG